MKRISLLILSLLLCFLSGNYSEAASAPGLMQGSGNPASSGKGGTGVSASGAEYFSLNPAALAEEERFFFYTGFGSLDMGFLFSDSIIAYPVSYGVIGGSFRYLSDEENSARYKNYAFSLGLGKDITSKLAFGLAVKGMRADYDSSNFYTGLSTGIHYRIPGTIRASGFGIFDPLLGVSADLGYYSDEITDLNSINAGYNFNFYKGSIFNLGLYNDFSAINNFRDYHFKLGLESLFMDRFIIRGGAAFPDHYDYMTWTAGAGYRLADDNYSAAFDYSFTYSEKTGVSHFAGATINYGALDTDPPVVNIEPDYKFISPNYDGKQDYLIFSIDVSDKSHIKGWRLQIYNEAEVMVREFRISDRDIEEQLTFRYFFRKLISKKESMIVPSGILWDGSDGRGGILPDGVYKYYFYAWDARDNISPVKAGAVMIDTVAPEVTLRPLSYIFSPNDDGNLDYLVIEQKIKSGPHDTWNAAIKNSAGETILSYTWKGDGVPEKFIWDGRNNSGELSPDGLYYYTISSSDRAGNTTYGEVKEITLTTKMEIADIRLSEEYFSYDNSPAKQIRMFPDLSDRKGLDKWEIKISDRNGRGIKSITGGGALPPFIDWGCRDDNGNPLPDGEYFAKFQAWFASGNNPESYGKKIIFDNTPPVISLSHTPELFSPDDDGENDLLYIRINASDNSGFKGWELKIFNESRQLFKTFSGRGAPPAEIVWDGTGDSREELESASDYTMEIRAFDLAGNSGKATDRFSVDILVVVTERGLKMRISNIEFAFGSAAVSAKGAKILDRVAVILEKYRRYDVVVEGHTDNIGGADYNQKLSEKRAISVREYLVKKGVEPSRLRYEGLGESMPFYPNTNEENRRRNRRVEFLLIKHAE